MNRVKLQLERGIMFKCSCGQHSLTPDAVRRLQYAVRVCSSCGENLQPVDPIPVFEHGVYTSSSFFVCELDENGNHVLTYDTSDAIECNFPPPRIVMTEEMRKAVVRALYRPGDLEFCAEQNRDIRTRLVQLLNRAENSEKEDD